MNFFKIDNSLKIYKAYQNIYGIFDGQLFVDPASVEVADFDTII